MARLSKAEVESALSESTGLSTEQVAQFFEKLARLAQREGRHGFLLPGFGEFRVERGEGRSGVNPFTGEPIAIKGNFELTFHADTTATEAFTAAQSAPASDPGPEPAPTVFPETFLAIAPQQGVETPPDWRTKLGGTPDWIQGDEEQPRCCSRDMAFFAQIDSDGLEAFNIVDAGSLYVFVCETCWKSKAYMQSH